MFVPLALIWHEPIDDESRGDQDRVPLECQVGGLLVEERAVLDRPAPRPEGRHDSGLPVTVRRDDPIRSRGLRDDRRELLGRELGMHRMVQLTRDATGSEDFDDPRSRPKLHPHPFQTFGHAVAKVREAKAMRQLMNVVERK